MSSILIDRAEPSEALSTTTVWSEGLPGSKKLLSSIQLDQFRRGIDLEQEIDVRGRRGAYFVNDSINLLSLEHKSQTIFQFLIHHKQLFSLFYQTHTVYVCVVKIVQCNEGLYLLHNSQILTNTNHY